MKDDLISRQVAKDYIDSQKGRPFIGCTIGEAMKIMLDEVPSAQPVNIAKLQPNCNQVASDCISRQAAIKAADSIINRDTSGNNDVVRAMTAWKEYIKALPSAQPGQRNAIVFQGIVVEYPSISAYPEYEGKPYFSIKYTENGQEFIGYGTYKPEVLSEYLKENFMPPAQPGWIPWDSDRFPEESGTYTITAYDGATKRVTYAKYQKRLKRWELTGSRAYWKVLAWQPLPTPWEGKEQ